MSSIKSTNPFAHSKNPFAHLALTIEMNAARGMYNRNHIHSSIGKRTPTSSTEGSGMSDISEDNQGSVPMEIDPAYIALGNAKVWLNVEYFIPSNELLFIVPDGGPVQFIRGDRPQEFFGTEVCLVRNHRFDGFYFLRSNGIVGKMVMKMISKNLVDTCSIEERNRLYLANKGYLLERVIGVDCGMYVDETKKPYSPMISRKGLQFYHKAMLVFSSPVAMSAARRGSESGRPTGFFPILPIMEDGTKSMKRLSVESNARKSTEETPNSVLVMTRGSLENPSIPMESNRSVFKTRGSLESPKIPMESNISAVKSRGPLEILPMPLESERSMIKSDRIKSGLFEKEIIPAIRTSFSKENKSQTHELDFLKPSGMDVFEDESSTIEQTSSSAPEVPFTKVKRRKGRNFVEPKVLYEVTDIPMTKGNEKPNSRKFTSSTKSDTTDDFSKADITAYDAVSFVDEKITKALTRREKGTLAAKAIAAQMVPRHLNKKTNTLYKTEMCRNWDESGECRYGRSCQFAHGGKDLRHVDRHGQWKTKTCLAWVNGGCTYGSRCCYAHEHLDQVQSPKPDPRIVEEIQELASAKSKSRSKAASHKNTVMYSEKLPAGISRFTKFFEQLATVGKDPIN